MILQELFHELYSSNLYLDFPEVFFDRSFFLFGQLLQCNLKLSLLMLNHYVMHILFQRLRHLVMVKVQLFSIFSYIFFSNIKSLYITAICDIRKTNFGRIFYINNLSYILFICIHNY